MNTYFILGKKTENCPSYQGSFRAEGRQKYANSLQLFVSPPASATSLSPHARPRVLSCDTSHIKTPQNKNFLSPDSCIVKASSLPSILGEYKHILVKSKCVVSTANENTDM